MQYVHANEEKDGKQWVVKTLLNWPAVEPAALHNPQLNVSALFAQAPSPTWSRLMYELDVDSLEMQPQLLAFLRANFSSIYCHDITTNWDDLLMLCEGTQEKYKGELANILSENVQFLEEVIQHYKDPTPLIRLGTLVPGVLAPYSGDQLFWRNLFMSTADDKRKWVFLELSRHFPSMHNTLVPLLKMGTINAPGPGESEGYADLLPAVLQEMPLFEGDLLGLVKQHYSSLSVEDATSEDTLGWLLRTATALRTKHHDFFAFLYQSVMSYKDEDKDRCQHSLITLIQDHQDISEQLLFLHEHWVTILELVPEPDRYEFLRAACTTLYRVKDSDKLLSIERELPNYLKLCRSGTERVELMLFLANNMPKSKTDLQRFFQQNFVEITEQAAADGESDAIIRLVVALYKGQRNDAITIIIDHFDVFFANTPAHKFTHQMSYLKSELTGYECLLSLPKNDIVRTFNQFREDEASQTDMANMLTFIQHEHLSPKNEPVESGLNDDLWVLILAYLAPAGTADEMVKNVAHKALYPTSGTKPNPQIRSTLFPRLDWYPELSGSSEIANPVHSSFLNETRKSENVDSAFRKN